MWRLVRAYRLTFCIGLRLLILGAVAVGGLGPGTPLAPPVEDGMNPLVPKFSKDALQVRLHHLEDDCASQPALVRQAGEVLAYVRKELKLAKEALALREVEITKGMRLTPSDWDLEPGTRVTEKMTDHACRQDLDWIALRRQVIDWEHDEDTLDTFMKALASRDRMLECEVKLHGQTYFSKPDTRILGREDVHRVDRQIDEALNDQPKPAAKKATRPKNRR